MRISVQFPMHTKSENVLRSLPFVVANAARKHGTAGASKAMGIAHSIAGKVKKQRREVRMILDSQLPRLRRTIDRRGEHGDRFTAAANFYRVTMIRISAGVLDDDGLKGALKAVRDEVAAWLGCGDGPNDPVAWRYGQQKGPAKVYAVRIEIEDDDPDKRDVHKIVGPTIAKLGPVIGDCAHCGRPVPYEQSEGRAALLRVQTKLAQHRSVQRQEQTKLVFRRAFYALAEEQTADELRLHELDTLPGGDNPPLRVRIAGRLFARRLETDPALGEFWIYEAAPSAAPAPEERAST